MHIATLLFTSTLACAHVAMWDKGMYGYNYPNQASGKSTSQPC
jgi:hypothetical protein